MSICYYDILRVRPDASSAEVRVAYKKLAQQYHPDKHKGSIDAAKRMAEINEAYSIISVPAARLAYEQKRRALAGKKTAKPANNTVSFNNDFAGAQLRKKIPDIFTAFCALVIIGMIIVNL